MRVNLLLASAGSKRGYPPTRTPARSRAHARAHARAQAGKRGLQAGEVQEQKYIIRSSFGLGHGHACCQGRQVGSASFDQASRPVRHTRVCMFRQRLLFSPLLFFSPSRLLSLSPLPLLLDPLSVSPSLFPLLSWAPSLLLSYSHFPLLSTRSRNAKS